MAKKDFSNINTAPVYGAIAEATAEQGTQEAHFKQEGPEITKAAIEAAERSRYSVQEAAGFLNNLQSTGRKGLKLPRINLAFAPDIYEYIQHMSRIKGESMTVFVNNILRQHMEDHREIYEKAKEFKNSL